MLLSVGASSMTMDEVARACGISKRTLYEIFPDKRTLIGECMHRQHQIKNAEIKEIFGTADNCFEAMYKVYMRTRKMYESTSVAFLSDIKRLFREKTGEELTNDACPRVEKYAHGGMSSGMVSGHFWLNTAIPLLLALLSIAENNMAEFDSILADGTARFALKSHPCSPN